MTDLRTALTGSIAQVERTVLIHQAQSGWRLAQRTYGDTRMAWLRKAQECAVRAREVA